MHDHTSGPGLSADAILAAPFVFALILYLTGVGIQIHRRGSWPWYRTAAWVGGIAAAASGFAGPLAASAHGDVVAHMGAHLLVGMVAPVLLVVAAPVTLALRSLHVTRARRLSALLRSWPARFLTLPPIAGVMNVGSMWLLYRTPLYNEMQAVMLVHLLVMMHLLVAGYLFTVAIIPTDPAPHRTGYPMRLVVLVAAIAAHNVLAKSLYAQPPAGAGLDEGQQAALLMYYGGGVVEIVIIVRLCAQWYRDAGRDLTRPGSSSAGTASPGRRRGRFPRTS